MANPKELKYTKTHEWAAFLDETTANIGITDYAQSHLGDLVFVNLPEAGARAEAGQAVCDIESVKTVSDVISPVTGTVAEGNEEVADAPAKLNEAPYDAWIFRVEGITERGELMDFEAYEAFCREEDE